MPIRVKLFLPTMKSFLMVLMLSQNAVHILYIFLAIVQFHDGYLETRKTRILSSFFCRNKLTFWHDMNFWEFHIDIELLKGLIHNGESRFMNL